MGHDIYAYTKKDGEELAYLRRGGFNPMARVIYKALEAEQYDNGVSGSGEGQWFSGTRLLAAFHSLPYDDDYKPERDFLDKAYWGNDEKGAYVWFG